ncbi:MAG: glycosyltransferase family 4 protein [Actinomycetia bacterium]|nr:glycosyltransferase family 4 protein [Actinomycetes bacterium]
MRINHLISSGGLYGAEKMIINLALGQQALGANVTITVFRNSHAPNVEVADQARALGIDVAILPCKGRFDPLAVRQLRRALRSQHTTVLHTHGYKANLYGYLASRGLPLTVIGTCHRFDTGAHNRFDGPILRRYDAVAGVSDEAAGLLVSQYHLNSAKVVSIPNGISIPERPASAADSDAYPTHPTVAMVGRLAPEKAPEDFVKVAANLHTEHPEVRFVIAGDGPLRPDLEQMVQESGLDSVVQFLGFREDIESIYDAVQILLQPSLREGMPMTTLEAMAGQVAIVATKVGALPDVIQSGVNGLLVDTHDVQGMTAAVAQLLDNPDQAARMAAQGRADVIARYGSQTMARSYLNLYQDAALAQQSAA